MKASPEVHRAEHVPARGPAVRVTAAHLDLDPAVARRDRRPGGDQLGEPEARRGPRRRPAALVVALPRGGPLRHRRGQPQPAVPDPHAVRGPRREARLARPLGVGDPPGRCPAFGRGGGRRRDQGRGGERASRAWRRAGTAGGFAPADGTRRQPLPSHESHDSAMRADAAPAPRLGRVTFRLYDTATREVRDFVPLEEGKAGLYVCGLTVQSEPHVGHVRAASTSTSCSAGCATAATTSRSSATSPTSTTRSSSRPPSRAGPGTTSPTRCTASSTRRTPRSTSRRRRTSPPPPATSPR